MISMSLFRALAAQGGGFVLSILLCSNSAPVMAQGADAADSMRAFQRTFSRIAKDEGDALGEYVRLQSIYDRMGEEKPNQAAQLLSMADAMFGRYRDAEDHYYAAFPGGNKSVACPVSGVTVQPALEMIRRVAADTRVLLINESHSMMITRAFIYQLLPVLRSSGFKYLALESLAPSSDKLANTQAMKVLQDTALPVRGYPLDRSSGGFYLREPIHAEIVREAVAQGFILVAYEALHANTREEREEEQANALARLIASDSQAKIAIVAGYGHISKSDGWMADRLQNMLTEKIFSIDQVSGIFGCEDPPEDGSLAPYVLADTNGKEWASKSDRVDVTVLHRARKDGRMASSGWLTLNGERKGIVPDTVSCGQAWPCLVSAIYANEEEQAVPADRVLLTGAGDQSLLFLKPGVYRYVVKPQGGLQTISELIVP